MNRFEFAPASLIEGEVVVSRHDSVKIYDGHEKVAKFNVFNVIQLIIFLSDFIFRWRINSHNSSNIVGKNW